MDSSGSTSTNKKKRKVTELIACYEVAQAPLPPPLEPETLSPNSVDRQGLAPLAKKSKHSESVDGDIVLPPPPTDQARRRLRSSTSRPKLSTLSLSERRLRERQRSEAANEILSSEKSYVTSLETFVNHFAYPLQASKSGLISEADRILLCSDIEMILQLNRAFLTQITERMRLFTSKTPISDIFLSFMPHFKMYTVYCCKHAQITDLVIKLRADNKGFKSFLKKAETNAKHQIADYLIAPVQRVPRLALLLESLLKFTDTTHPDYDQLKLALEEAQNAAKQINTRMHELEVRSKVVAIHKSFDPMIEDFLDGPLVQPHRVFVHEGVLARKSGARAMDDDWSDSEEDECDKQEESEKGKYYCFLFNDMFLVGTSIGKGKTKRLVYETSFELATTFIREDMNALCFQMVNPRCTYTWLTQSTADVAEWKRAVEETVENLLKQHPSLRAQRARVDVTLDDETNEWSAEIRTTPRACAVDPARYREEVLENTQKHLTQFMHEHHERLIKHKATFGSPKKLPSSVFQRVKDSLTPKKRTSVKVGDENSANLCHSSPSTHGLLGSPLQQNNLLSHPMQQGFHQQVLQSAQTSGSRKSEKHAELVSTEEMDGVTCINRHLEMLTQELQTVREMRRQVRQGVSSTSITSPNRRPLSRVESMAIPSTKTGQLEPQTIRQLKSALSSNHFSLTPLQLPPSPPTTVAHLTRKKSKSIKMAEKRSTLAAPTLSSAATRRQTVVVGPTPASPIALPPRAADTESVFTRKATPKTSRKTRMSLGGGDTHKLLTKASMATPHSISEI